MARVGVKEPSAPHPNPPPQGGRAFGSRRHTVPDFTYEALSATGERSQGSLTANNEREALSMLDARGLFPIRIAAAQSKSRFSFGKVGGRHMATFYSQLADLLHAGVPLLRSLDILEKQGNNPVLQQAVREVRAEVAEGTG